MSMDSDEFRRAGHEFVDWVADYFESVEKYPVLSQVGPGDIKRRLPPAPPGLGEPMNRIFQDFQDIVLPGITHWQHPSWFGYFPANNSPASVLAELLTAGLGAQCMVWQTSPAAAELEEGVLEWLRQMLGLPAGMAGVIQDTASTATLCALLSAREKATGFEANEKGLSRKLTVYASDQAHSSVEKGVKIAGYGRENLRYIPTDDAYAMIPGALDQALARDEAAGFQRLHGRPRLPHPGHHQALRAQGLLRAIGYPELRAQVAQGRLHAAQVAGLVVNHRDAHRHPRRPAAGARLAEARAAPARST